ncbi:MAG: phenylalanine 4-monooxygenase [Marivibrio sp.]|uniref:phenylalanine 4-monooxygenase n=1 Tax=Marivibrio sp. TaxID=2039719 RepID=UPI0032EC7B64
MTDPLYPRAVDPAGKLGDSPYYAAPNPGARYDGYVVDQDWAAYSPAEHAVWRTLFERQRSLLPGRVDQPFLDGLQALVGGLGAEAAARIPDFRDLNRVLAARTGFEIVGVPGLIPEAQFFAMLADRVFPVTRWIRTPERLDYLQEPDLFHDLFGHVPLLTDPIFADFIQTYGKAGSTALKTGDIARLARLYWYTVEFGLIKRPGEDLKIYGAGIVSSATETRFALESPSPNRIRFERERLLATDYRIDDFQETYWVVEDYAQLFHALDGYEAGDLAALYRLLDMRPDYAPGAVLPTDSVVSRGDGSHHRAGRAA